MGSLNEIHFTSFNGIVIDNDAILDSEVNLNNIYINGKGLFTEDVDAEKFSVYGEARVKGLLSCDEITVEGTCYCEDSLISERITVSGVLEVIGKISSDDIIVSGNVLSQGDVNVALLDISGGLSCDKTISCETAKIQGYVNIKGTLKALDLFMESADISRIAKISVDNADVKKNMLSLKQDIPEFILECGQLDCESAYLENCKIGVLLCDDAEIGPGCVIDEIAYRKTLKFHETAKIGKKAIV